MADNVIEDRGDFAVAAECGVLKLVVHDPYFETSRIEVPD